MEWLLDRLVSNALSCCTMYIDLNLNQELKEFAFKRIITPNSWVKTLNEIYIVPHRYGFIKKWLQWNLMNEMYLQTKEGHSKHKQDLLLSFIQMNLFK